MVPSADNPAIVSDVFHFNSVLTSGAFVVDAVAAYFVTTSRFAIKVTNQRERDKSLSK